MGNLDDYNEIERLAKVSHPTSFDLDSIWSMYIKYIDGSAPTPNRNGCSTCSNSIVVYWRKLMAWWQDNKNNFLS